MKSVSLTLSAIVAVAVSATATAQSGSAREPWDPDQALQQERRVAGAREASELPDDLRGQAAAFPVGRRRDELKAVVYVPSYYDPARTWPVLVEGVERGRLSKALAEFRPQAERHGFVLVAVEYLFHKGRDEGTYDVWTRQGGGTIRQHSRTVPEFLADMRVDEKNILAMLRDLERKYSVERRAVGVTGFLGAGVMAYRLPMEYPHLFALGIGRSAGFAADFMPRQFAKAKGIPFYVIFGENEEEVTLGGAERAIAFFKARKFRNVTAEEIPGSGVDSRPEIAGNYFRAAVDDLLGPERAVFDRAVNRAGMFLDGTLPEDVRTPEGRRYDAAAILAPLEILAEKHPKSEHLGVALFLAARVRLESLDDRAGAEPILRRFESAPLLNDAAAPESLVYLVEQIIDTRTQSGAREAEMLLKRARSRPAAPEQVKTRADTLLDHLKAWSPAAGA